MRDALSYIDEHADSFLQQLKDFLRIPSISALPEHKEDMKKCVGWLVSHLHDLGFPLVEIFETKGHPIVYASWSTDAGKPTVLSYGHYDVQPPDPLSEWASPPFEPAVKDGHIYARGASDDKGQIFTHLKAIESLVRTRGTLPVNVKLLIEGEEEVSSLNLEGFVAQNRSLLSCDTVCISDTGIGSLVAPCLTYGLPGIVYYEIIIRTASRDLHSGFYGGVAPNPFKFLAKIVSEVQGSDGKILIPGFYDSVRGATEYEKKLMSENAVSGDELQSSINIPFFFGEKEYSLDERMGLRPTFEVHGMPGGFTGEGSKTVIPAKAGLKLSFRLIPDQKPAETGALFESWVRSLLPEGLSVEVRNLGEGESWIADQSEPVYEKARIALMKGFRASKTGGSYSGGSIPVISMFAEKLQRPIVLMGFGLPDDNLHAPNERFGLDRFYGGIRAMSYFYEEISKS